MLYRIQELQKAGVQPQEQLDNATTSVQSLQAKIDLAKAQANAAEARTAEAQQAVDNCTIRAPFDGIVVSKDAQVGEMVSPISAGGGFTRTGIATIVNMNSNEIEVDVNEAYITRVKPGQQVTAIMGLLAGLPPAMRCLATCGRRLARTLAKSRHLSRSVCNTAAVMRFVSGHRVSDAVSAASTFNLPHCAIR